MWSKESNSVAVEGECESSAGEREMEPLPRLKRGRRVVVVAGLPCEVSASFKVGHGLHSLSSHVYLALTAV